MPRAPPQVQDEGIGKGGGMSFHHSMMLQRYGLGRPVDVYSIVNCDPIFTPLFTALLGPLGAIQIGATGLTVASVAAAIAAGGDCLEFSI